MTGECGCEAPAIAGGVLGEYWDGTCRRCGLLVLLSQAATTDDEVELAWAGDEEEGA